MITSTNVENLLKEMGYNNKLDSYPVKAVRCFFADQGILYNVNLTCYTLTFDSLDKEFLFRMKYSHVL